MILRLIFILTLVLFAHTGARADVSDIRIAGDGAPTRVTIWTDADENPQAFLRETETGQREIIVPLAANAYSSEGEGRGGVASWSLMPRQLVLRLDRPMAVIRVLRLPPTGKEARHRLILDLDTVSPARFATVARRDMRAFAKAEAEAAPKEAAPTRTSARKRDASRFVIVIDPGHGGKDPGARAINGGVEKEIVLLAALELKGLLERNPRYEVRLTREDDRYIELDERVTMARDWGADLFISLHADAAGSKSVEGASVYTISERGERRVDATADKHNWKIPIEDGTPERVSGILQDLVKRETKSRSAEFAELLLPELAEAGPVLRNTHRNAGFYVLLAPDVPAVLLELGFLTNADDAKRLRSEQGRRRAAAAIQRAIDAYFDAHELRLAQR